MTKRHLFKTSVLSGLAMLFPAAKQPWYYLHADCAKFGAVARSCDEIFTKGHPINKWMARKVGEVEKGKSPVYYFSDKSLRNKQYLTHDEIKTLLKV